MKNGRLKKIVQFRETIKNVVSMLVSRDIPVIERGTGAYVQYDKKSGEPLLICVPSIPDDATDSFLMAVRGFMDHEVAHILFTDVKAGSGFLWNAVEDIFIEKRMAETFLGSKANLGNTHQHVIDTVFNVRESRAFVDTMGDQYRLFLEFYLVPVLRAWAGQLPFIDYMKPRWGNVSEPVKILTNAGVDKMLNKITCSKDANSVAALIAKLLREGKESKKDSEPTKDSKPAPTLKDKPEEPEASSADHEEPDDHEEPEASADEPDDAEETFSTSDNEPEESGYVPPEAEHNNEDLESEAGESGDTESGDSESEGTETEDGDSEEAEGAETEGGKEGETEDAESGSDIPEDDIDSTESGDGDSEDDTAGDGKIPEPSEDDLQELSDFKLPKDAPDMSIEGALKATIDAGLEVSTGYRPYERTFDFMGLLEHAGRFMANMWAEHGNDKFKVYGLPEQYIVRDRHIGNFDRDIHPRISGEVVSTLTKDLERAIASKNRTQYIPGQRRGKIHGPSLHRLTMQDDRVFRTKFEKRAVNSCVQIVIDLSGSMNGERIKTACAAAYALSEALARINVKTMITGFTTHTRPYEESEFRAFNRTEALFLPIIKDWNVSVTDNQTKANLGAIIKTIILAENVDGESIATLMQHFTGRTEDKKIMVVLSDGSPACRGHGIEEHLKRVTKQIEEDTDVSLLAIGIQTDAPKRFYSNHTCIDSVADLPVTMIKEIQKLIA